jgi:tetratricopeptide (TPR) repeat protein
MAFLARRQDWARRELERLRAEYSGEALYAYWLGKLDFDGQDLRAAAQNFEAAIRLDPSFVKAHDMLAVAEGVDGREEEAAARHRAAVALNRKSVKPSAWPPLNYGILLTRTNQARAAEPLLREALRYEPKLAEAHYRLAACLEKQSKNADAREEYARAAELDPLMPEPWYGLARISRAEGREAEDVQAMAEFEERTAAKKTEAPRPPNASMTSRVRLLTALRGGTPDRAPKRRSFATAGIFSRRVRMLYGVNDLLFIQMGGLNVSVQSGDGR